ncbi:MAG: hypothetical protein II916_03030, partial [Oscillospiraceae bacterium]|nr:hypothetical protein [Oscillospiraceae bacterium]
SFGICTFIITQIRQKEKARKSIFKTIRTHFIHFVGAGGAAPCKNSPLLGDKQAAQGGGEETRLFF